MRAHVASITEAGDVAAQSAESLKDWINTNLIIDLLGITDALDEELEMVAAHTEDATTVFSDILSLRTHIGWSTHGHSAVDANIYSSGGPAVEPLRGNNENTDIGKFLRHYLGVSVDDITAELNEKMVAGQPALAPMNAQGLPLSDYEMEGVQKHY